MTIIGKLKLLRPTLRTVAPRVREESERQLVDETTRRLIRAWLSSAAWQELRLKVFERDGLVCQRSRVVCVGKHPAANSPVANHKRPHRGDPALFWEIDNLETVTKQVHDQLIQREEQAIPGGIWR